MRSGVSSAVYCTGWREFICLGKDGGQNEENPKPTKPRPLPDQLTGWSWKRRVAKCDAKGQDYSC